MRTQGKSCTRQFTERWLLILVACALAEPATAATVPTGFTETVIASGLADPTAMQFAPDGRLFVCEQSGRLRVIKDGVLLPTPFTTLTVDANGERGLLGVAFDPAFLTTPYVYVYYTARTPTVHNRISRFTANGDVAVAGSETVLLELDNLSSATNHNGGALAFGPDGKLYAAVGENANGSNAQSMSNLLGKMLRLNKDGSIPTDNPFYSSTTDRNRAIWAYGLRNPFTFAFNPTGAEMFLNDVGQGTWEEINDGVAGANYGWPWTEGPTTQFDGPRYAYNHSGGACAITGGAFYSPLTIRFPSGYSNDYFFADYCAGWIRKLDPAAGNSVVTFATGISSPVDLKVSDDGGLYYLARGTGSNTGAVYRIDYGSAAPSITTHPVSQTVAPGGSVTFSVRASGPPVLRYQWQRNGVDIGGATAEDYTMSAAQSDNGARFRAVVSNDSGSVVSNEAVLTVAANQAPTGTITQPVAGTLYSAGNVITYAGTATDPEDGTLSGAAFTWRVDFHHDTHTHPFIPPTSGTSGSFTIPATGETSANVWYRIYLTVQDSGGLTHTTQRDILPRTVRLTLATNPAGLQLTLDGQPLATPFSFDSVVGMVRDLEATTPQTSGGTTYGFLTWSDGGATRHTISAPAANTTYTATYGVSGGGNPGLRAGYGFNDGGGTSVSDASGNGLNGAITGGATWTTSGRFGGAVNFDGIDDRVTVGSSSLLNLTTGTVEAWVRLDTVGRWHGVIAKGNTNTDRGHNYAIEIEDGNLVNCVIGNGTSSNIVRSTTQVAAQQFYHLACAWDGSQLRLYINGALNRSVSQTVTPAANSSPLFIGQYGGNVDRLDGVIDEVRIYDVARTQAQIQSDMNTPVGTPPPPPPPPPDSTPPVRSNGQPTGTLAAWTTQAPLSLTTSENATCRYGPTAGVAYAALPNPFTTTGGTAHSTTVAGLVNGGSYTYFVRCQDGASNANPDDFQISFAVAQPSGLRAGYGFNDGSGTSVSDASGNGLTGAIAGGAAWTTAGQFGGALTFDGIDDRVTVAASPLLNLTTGTVEAWVRLDTVGRWHGVVAKGNANTDPGHNYAIEIENTNFVSCVIGNGTSSNAVRSTTQVAAGQFYHLACAWDGSQLRLYINGVLNRSVSQTITPASNSAPLFIGQYGGNVDRFDGVIDEVRIYNVALAQAQIQNDMNTPVR
jgi:glucose/arabinose dehydrogenase